MAKFATHQGTVERSEARICSIKLWYPREMKAPVKRSSWGTGYSGTGSGPKVNTPSQGSMNLFPCSEGKGRNEAMILATMSVIPYSYAEPFLFLNSWNSLQLETFWANELCGSLLGVNLEFNWQTGRTICS